MNAPEVVCRYAAALLAAAVETEVLDRIRQDVESLIAVLRQSAELAAFWEDPLLDAEVKGRVIRDLFAGKVDELTLNFLLLMAQRWRAGLIPQALGAFLDMAEERTGVVRAQVKTAVELSEEQAERLRERLAACSGKEVRLQVEVDENLRGGLIARIGDTVFDGSLDTQLRRMHRQLRGG